MHYYRPGDLIGFRRDSCVGKTIRLCSCAVWPWIPPAHRINHVAVIAPSPHGGELLIWESTTTLPDNWVCQVSGNAGVKGVQASKINKRLRYEARCKGSAWHFTLRGPLDPTQLRVLWFFCEQMLGTPYDYTDVFGARSLGFGWLRHLIGKLGYLPDYRDNGRLFCSEFAVMVHNSVALTGLLHPSHWSPSRFVAYERRKKILDKPRLIVDEGRMVG